MVKRALLVGCNYPGSESQLTGCINDVTAMKETLMEIYGFEEDNIVMMVDVKPTPTETSCEQSAAEDAEETGIEPSTAEDAEETGSEPSPTEDAEETGSEPSPTEDAEETGSEPSPTEDAEETGSEPSPTEDAEETGSEPSPAEDAEETSSKPAPAEDEDLYLPTYKNIVRCLSNMIRISEEGDVLFFHFSGHGGQIPSEDDDEEIDGQDEVIYPTDFNYLTDDTFKDLLSELPEGVTFTFVADSCRSGGLLDNAELQVGIGENQEIGDQTEVTAKDLAALSFKTPIPTAGKGREVPVETIMRRLAAASGHEVTLGTIRTTTYELFQEDANSMVKKYVKTMLSHMHDTPPEKWEQTYGEAGAQALKHLQQIWDDESIDNDVFFSAALNYQSPNKPDGETEDRPRGKAILFSGSESDQNSADLGTGGALSNAIQAVVTLNGGAITNKKLANEIRKVLVRRNLDQRPCLFCPPDMLDANFICDLD